MTRILYLLLAFLSVAAAPAGAVEKIGVAALPFVSSAPVFIAKERGYFAAEGLEAEVKILRAAQPVAVAVVSGDADFGVTAFTAAFFNLAGKGALKIIGAQSREEPGYEFSAYLVSNKAHEAGFDTLAEYPGHSLGITQKGSSFHLMIGLLAKAKAFDLEKVKLVPLESVPNMIAALKSGQVDSIILPAFIARSLDASGAAKIIGWVHEQTPYQLGALFTSSRTAEQKPETVRKFVRAYQRGAADYAEAFMQRTADGKRTMGDKAAALVPTIQKYTESKPGEILGGAPYIDPKGRLDLKSVYDQVAWFKSQGLVEADVDPAKFLALDFIEGHTNPPK